MTSPSEDQDREPIIEVVGRPVFTANLFRKAKIETMFEVWLGPDPREADLLFEFPDWPDAIEAAEQVRTVEQHHEVMVILRSRWLVWDGMTRALKRQRNTDNIRSELAEYQQKKRLSGQ